MDSNRITIAKAINPNLCDDIVFGRIAISLHAVGCAFLCPDCHSKRLCDFEYDDKIRINANDFLLDWKDSIDVVGVENITIVGVGGDFCFQILGWLAFCRDIKNVFGDGLKIVLYTGCMLYSALADEIRKFDEIKYIDAIIWGRSDAATEWQYEREYIVKTSTYAPFHRYDTNESKTWTIKKV